LQLGGVLGLLLLDELDLGQGLLEVGLWLLELRTEALLDIGCGTGFKVADVNLTTLELFGFAFDV